MNNYLFDNEINNKQNIDDFRIPQMSRNNRQTNNRNDYRFDNGVNNNQQRDVTMPQVSNNSRPINNSHDNYIFDRNAQVFYNQNQGNYHNPMNTRTITNNKPVQNNFQNEHTQNYFMSNFETINNGQEINMYQDRNPVDTRRDQLEKTRSNVFRAWPTPRARSRNYAASNLRPRMRQLLALCALSQHPFAKATRIQLQNSPTRTHSIHLQNQAL